MLFNQQKYLKPAAVLHAKTNDFHSNTMLIQINKYTNILVESEINV